MPDTALLASGSHDQANRAAPPEHSFPGQGQMKPEQSEIARLKREVAKLKAERDILKNCPGRLARLRAVETARAILAVGG